MCGFLPRIKRKGRIVAECVRLESGYTERYREFESRPFRFVRGESCSLRTSASSVQAIMWYLYILLCDGKTFYVGITNNFKERLKFHKSKKAFFTKKFSDIKMVYTEMFSNKTEAARREKQLKGWSRIK